MSALREGSWWVPRESVKDKWAWSGRTTIVPSTSLIEWVFATPLAHVPGDAWRTRGGIFDEIFLVFLALGTLVGLVVFAYILYAAFKYRDGRAPDPDDDWDPPVLGELPIGEGGGKKLFLSFGISALIVISLIVYSYGLLLLVENPDFDADVDEDLAGELEIQVTGFQFAWQFEYPNGHQETGTMYVPENYVIWISVTSTDVWHNFGVTDLRVKADAIPGQTERTWFISPHVEDGDEDRYLAECFEHCGVGHSFMVAEVVVLPEEDFQEWYEETNGSQED